MVGMVITPARICHRLLYQFPPLGASAAGILLRVACIFVADGAEIGQKAEDLLEVEPLVCRVRVMVLRPVRAYQRGA